MQRPEHLRAFVALPLPRPLQEALAALTPDLLRAAPARLAVTRPGSWHLTLKFLGDVPRRGAAGVPGLVAALAAVDWEAFDLIPGGGGFFPGPARPRVIYVGLAAGGEGCRRLAAGVEEALAGLCPPREARTFTPHLTVARVRDAPGRGDFGPVAGLLARAAWPAFRARRFVLYESVPGPGGTRYEELMGFPARGGGEGG
jgi:2'-5' RNA ligase